MKPTIYKPSIYKGESIYNNGAGGGGGNIDLLFSRPVFVKQMTIPTDNQLSTYVYDARLDVLSEKIPAEYEQHRYLRNTKSIYGNSIDTGIVAEELNEDIDIDLVTCVYINQFSQYAKIIGNDYISNDDHYFALACGNSNINFVYAFVNSGYSGASEKAYKNAQAILLRQDYTNNYRYAGTITSDYNENYLSGYTGGNRNNSTIKIFSSALCSIYYLQIRKGGIVVMDLVPCKRLSDGVSGFYDKVSHSFLTNSNGDGLIAED